MYDIGIDLGTSSVKLLLLENGKIVRSAKGSYPLEFPHPGWSQQSPEDWWSAIVSAMAELLDGVDRSAVAGIGVAGQMHGLVAVDASGKVLYPAILWNDGRTGAETEYLNSAVGKGTLMAETGNIAFAGFTAPKLLWLKKNEPHIFGRIYKILLPKDYINYRLTGRFATDMSDASGMLLLDVKNRRWSEKMLDICGVKAEQLPELYESYQVIGTVRPEAAAELNIPETVTVAAGAGDNAAAAVGAGCINEGSCNISIGTSGTVFIPCDKFRTGDTGAIHAFCHSNGKYHVMGCMLSAASCLDWWGRKVCGTEDLAALQEKIPEELVGKNSVFFLPYLMGERAPHNDPAARGTFIGMTMDTDRSAMTLAVLEGVAFAIRDLLEGARDMGITVRESTLCGGGAKSRLWQQILADVLNMPLTLLNDDQGPGLGGALLSACGRGEYPNLAAAASAAAQKGTRIEPRRDVAALYDERYFVFRSLYPAVKNIFKKL
jgi:xylulokinase